MNIFHVYRCKQFVCIGNISKTFRKWSQMGKKFINFDKIRDS